jgi:hypothetical protein
LCGTPVVQRADASDCAAAPASRAEPGLPGGDDADELPLARARDGTGLQADLRGSYDRAGAGKALSIEEYAKAHKKKIRTTHLGAPCMPSCKFGMRCLDEVTKPTLYLAHEYSSYAADGTPLAKHEQSERWRQLVTTWVRFDVDGKASENYRIGSHRACREAAREAYGMLPSRLTAMISVLKQAPGRMQTAVALLKRDVDVAAA